MDKFQHQEVQAYLIKWTNRIHCQVFKTNKAIKLLNFLEWTNQDKLFKLEAKTKEW